MKLDRMKFIKTWWGNNIQEKPVWRTEDLPGPIYKEILVSEKLAYEIRRGTVVLGKPDTKVFTLLRTYFWEIASCILKPYSPYIISGITAIQHYLENDSIPKEVIVYTKSSSTRINLDGISKLSLEKQPVFFKQSDLHNSIKEVKKSKHYSLTFESPESVLIRIRPHYLRDYPAVISSFLKSINFDLDTLKELLQKGSRPIVHERLALLFEQIEKKTESNLIRNIVKLSKDYSSPGKKQILKDPLPEILAKPKVISDPNYVIRFRDQLRVYRSQIQAELESIAFPHWNLEKVLKYAKENKKYDTYHSSTIEGYRVTTEEIQALIDGKPIETTGVTREEIERKMALKGYLEAHKFVLEMVQDHFKNGNLMHELIIREIYAHLFSPSVEAGIADQDQIKRYRNIPVYIRNSRYVPPNYEKVDNLMRCLVEEVNEIENKAIRALIMHYGFVTVHPYSDGNGRVARFLMNYILSLAGLPWITIRIEDRDKYFKSLEIAQCDENIVPFKDFLKKYFEESKSFRLL